MAGSSSGIYVDRELEQLVLMRTRAALRQRQAEQKKVRIPIVEWAQENFYIAETGEPIVFEPFQRAVLRAAFSRGEDGHFPYRLVVISTVKKMGKTTLAAVVERWFAEEQTRFGEIYAVGNDQRQARERTYEKVLQSIQLTPGFKHRAGEGYLPNRWVCKANKMVCLTTGSKIEALSVDARGEAGANPDLTCWTELWGFEHPEAINFFHEMTPPPTKRDSIRLIETYAGFDGESLLLRQHYDLGKEGRQLTAGEFAEMSGEPVGVFHEAPNPDDLIPVWINETAGMFMYWDSGTNARRMPWQTEEYYKEEEKKLPSRKYHQLHLNEWVGGESEFLPQGAFEACREELPFLPPGDKTPAVLGVDAASTGDCFGIVLVTRHPQRKDDPAIRHCRKWDPREQGGRVDYDEPEAFIRTLVHGGCVRGHPQYHPFRKDPAECDHATRAYACEECCEACAANDLVPRYNIIEIAYDPYQLESMMGRMYKEQINTQPFNQQKERNIADSMFYDMVVQRRLAHNGDAALREHVINCNAKISKDEDSKLRIIKKAPDRKIDLAVASSMAIRRCLYLLI